MKAKALCVVLLSALLIWGLPTGTPVNLKNSETKVAKVASTAKAEQRVNAQEADVTVAVAETPQPQEPKQVPESQPEPLTDKQQLLQAAGVPSNEWSAADFIFTKESTWRPAATNNIGCIGLGQNCPDKNGNYWLVDACPDWQTNPVCQIKRFSHYATERYGGWWPAYNFWLENGWW